ncbi:hypothetical protein PHLGIDRAFT_129329 [Phlebiopsis gigantea 11061_1 CR5-6]|uniref:Uncharacterized protein n=1 Tax=Phlebiopsis gigantea (strain 11061_1 CR5-6) TaxID=745531 RepID=A0A0C3S3X6_PHLG1|nr:hypothetical protein PHLGIDRAFT_129329 [Phlebiopsis gigantea 11061_1 CR5-6]
MWDGVFKGEDDAYIVIYRTGEVPAPYDTVVAADWLILAPSGVGGKNDGLLSDQNYRFNTSGGNPPNTTCTPGGPFLRVKSVTNFCMFGGKWNSSA